MTLASRRRAERSALSNGPIINPELTIGVMPRSREPIAERAELIVAHRPKPWVVDLENLRAKLGRDGDEAFEACALGVRARAARALQAQMIGQAVGVEAEGEGLSASLRLKRLHIFVHRSPASTMIDCLVTMRLSSAPRNNAIRAMSSPSSVALMD